MSKRRGWSVRLAGHLPEPLLAAPERVLVNLAVVLIGASSLVPPPGSVIEAMPMFLRINFAFLYIIGGVCGLHGHWTDTRFTERVGALAIGLGSLVYIIESVEQRSWAATAVAVIFTAIALASAVRWLRATAFERQVRQRRDGEL